MRYLAWSKLLLLLLLLLLLFLLLVAKQGICLQDTHLGRRHLNATPKKVVKQYLLQHNKLRAQLGLPSLQWSEKLARYASWWAHQLQGSCELKHSGGDYGENLFWGSGKDWKAGDAVNAWGEEKAYYNHASNSCTQNKQCLHYTQMVWKQSKKVGCARVTCKSGDTIISCNYHPHGNVIGEKPF